MNLQGSCITLGDLIGVFGALGGGNVKLDQYDKGWTDNINSETEVGLYFLPPNYLNTKILFIFKLLHYNKYVKYKIVFHQ